jgi:hypothetical protein
VGFQKSASCVEQRAQADLDALAMIGCRRGMPVRCTRLGLCAAPEGSPRISCSAYGADWIAHCSLSEALQGMSEVQEALNEEAVASPSPGSTIEVAAMVVLFNGVTAGLAGLYVSTQSIAVTAVAAGLVALPALLCTLCGLRGTS